MPKILFMMPTLVFHEIYFSVNFRFNIHRNILLHILFIIITVSNGNDSLLKSPILSCMLFPTLVPAKATNEGANTYASSILVEDQIVVTGFGLANVAVASTRGIYKCGLSRTWKIHFSLPLFHFAFQFYQ